MDPKAALLEALDYFLSGDTATAADRLAGYLDWRRNGGYEPTIDFSDDDIAGMGLAKHTCCADHAAQWLFNRIKEECAQRGIEFDRLTPAVLDRIEDVLGESGEVA